MSTADATPAEAAAPTDRRAEVAGGVSTLPDPRFGITAARRSLLAKIVLWGNLICQMGIILTGGTVRVTGSGLGCSTWPNCEPGTFLPEFTPASGLHPLIEFGNRTLTGVLSIFAIAVLIVAWRWLRHYGPGFMKLAWVPLIGTGIQALLGAVVVWMDLHPGVVSPHFLVSPVIVALSTILVVRMYEGPGQRRLTVPSALLWLFIVFAAVGFIVMVLGTIVTGTGPHSGDSSDVYRIPMDPRMASWLHADAVMLFCGLLLGLVIALHALRARRPAIIAAWAMVGLTLLQAVIGYSQYFLGLPEPLVLLHLLGAAMFAGGITWVGTALFTWKPADADATVSVDTPVGVDPTTGSPTTVRPLPSSAPHDEGTLR